MLEGVAGGDVDGLLGLHGALHDGVVGEESIDVSGVGVVASRSLPLLKGGAVVGSGAGAGAGRAEP